MTTSGRPALVLLGSLAATREMWHLQMPFWSRHFDLIAWDYHGHGNGLEPSRMDSAASIADCVLADLDRQGVGRFHLVGISLGGMVALQIAHQAPTRVLRLVASHCRYYQTPQTREAWDERIALVSRAGTAAVEDATVERWLSPATRSDYAPRVDLVRAMLRSVTPASYAACAGAVRDFDARAWVQTITAPTLLVAGSADLAAPAEHVDELARCITGARFTRIPHGHHVPTLDTPQFYTRLVEDFLRA
jgi:3-oxoadipate enol-lactonase